MRDAAVAQGARDLARMPVGDRPTVDRNYRAN
jgi:hypothetical protein